MLTLIAVPDKERESLRDLVTAAVQKDLQRNREANTPRKRSDPGDSCRVSGTGRLARSFQCRWTRH
jgi:hypothetical protein